MLFFTQIYVVFYPSLFIHIRAIIISFRTTTIINLLFVQLALLIYVTFNNCTIQFNITYKQLILLCRKENVCVVNIYSIFTVALNDNSHCVGSYIIHLSYYNVLVDQSVSFKYMVATQFISQFSYAILYFILNVVVIT